MAFRLSEDERVRLPVIVNLDGFYLSFTREPVEIPSEEEASSFLPPFDPKGISFRASTPTSQAVAVLGGSPYSYFRYETHLAAMNALAVYDEISDAFARVFGRTHGAIEAYRSDDAEVVFVMMGSFATKAKAAVDKLRGAGWKVGLLRPRLLRPFPGELFRRLLAGKKGVAVVDQNISMGKGGVLHGELASVLYGAPGAPLVLASFIGGLGGRDIAFEEFFEMARVTREAALSGTTPPPRLLYRRDELRELRKLQAVANVERGELGG
jgi:pyruvate ferredoxin oxidoreductase alpha subunit